MKFVYREIGHVLRFEEGFVNELIIENRKLFFDVVRSIHMQVDGHDGGCILSIDDKPMDFSKYADVTVQFAPFRINRKNLLTKLYTALEQRALRVENHLKASELLNTIEAFLLCLSDDLPVSINCQKLAVGSIIKAIAPEVEEMDETPLESLFSYMELVRELDRDRLFIMINMRTYFSDEDMERFIESACLHDFKVLLLENFSQAALKNVKRYTVDEDLCEF